MNKSSFGRNRDQRNLLIRNLATSVILYESVVTTAARGKVVQPVVDRLIRVGQNDDKITARRQLQSYILHPNAVDKILNELVHRYEGQTSGFTRRFHLPNRKGDGAPQVVIQLTKSVLLTKPAPSEPGKRTNNKNAKEKVASEPDVAEVNHG